MMGLWFWLLPLIPLLPNPIVDVVGKICDPHPEQELFDDLP